MGRICQRIVCRCSQRTTPSERGDKGGTYEEKKSSKETWPDNVSIEMDAAPEEIGMEAMCIILNKIYSPRDHFHPPHSCRQVRNVGKKTALLFHRLQEGAWLCSTWWAFPSSCKHWERGKGFPTHSQALLSRRSSGLDRQRSRRFLHYRAWWKTRLHHAARPVQFVQLRHPPWAFK